MGFQLRFHEDETTGLVAVCDVCGELVKADEGNILWSPSLREAFGRLHDFKITCRDECTRQIDNDEGHQSSQSLDVAIGYLMNNVKLDVKKMRQNMRLLAMIE